MRVNVEGVARTYLKRLNEYLEDSTNKAIDGIDRIVKAYDDRIAEFESEVQDGHRHKLFLEMRKNDICMSLTHEGSLVIDIMLPMDGDNITMEAISELVKEGKVSLESTPKGPWVKLI